MAATGVTFGPVGSAYWGTPSEIVLKGATDCKGFAIMKFWLARLPGLDDGELALLIGILPSTHQMHAVLLVATTGTPVVLDNRPADVVDIPIVRSMIARGCDALRRLNGGIASGLQQQMKNSCLVARQQ
jgi:hypothetical protein